MSENKHTPEPLSYGEDNDGWYVARGNEQIGYCLTEDDARRIVACVNACAGISTENLEENLPVKELARRYNKTLRQRDKLLAALVHIQQVACSGSPELSIASEAIASVKGGAA